MTCPTSDPEILVVLSAPPFSLRAELFIRESTPTTPDPTSSFTLPLFFFFCLSMSVGPTTYHYFPSSTPYPYLFRTLYSDSHSLFFIAIPRHVLRQIECNDSKSDHRKARAAQKFWWAMHSMMNIWLQSQFNNSLRPIQYLFNQLTPSLKCRRRVNPMSILLKNSTEATKITTTFSLSNLQEIAAWNAPAVARAAHSRGVERTARSTHLGSGWAEPCFITNVSGYAHRRAHFINVIEVKDDRSATNNFVVVNPGIVVPAFDLYSAFNLVKSELGLVALHFLSYSLFRQCMRRFMSQWTMFVVTCSHKFLYMAAES